MDSFINVSIANLKNNFQLYLQKNISLKGWIKNNRVGKHISFLVIQDGSGLEELQILYNAKSNNKYNYENLQKYPIGSAVIVNGQAIKAKNPKEKIELILESIEIINLVQNNYFLQKKNHSLEFLRTYSELRARSRYFFCIFRIRNELIKIIHNFFQNKNYHYLQAPTITNNDCEGGGESFFLADKNFFKKKALLSVSGQLHAEAIAQCFKKVYTFGPTFRADKSNTRFHASEFWMLEPEIAFGKAATGMKVAINLIKETAQKIQNQMQKEIEYLSEKNNVNLKEKIQNLINSSFPSLSYTEAIEILQKNRKKFQIQNIEWGMDLQKEHEKFFCKKWNGPVFITDYPQKIKAFYMKQNSDNKTVACFDLLFPEIGEVVGGSERENEWEKLKRAAEVKGIFSKEIEWYLNLRKQGYSGSVGFGMGFDRFLMYLTGTKNIRDTIPFYSGIGVLKY